MNSIKFYLRNQLGYITFDYNPNYGMIYGDYNSGGINLIKNIAYPSSENKKYKFGIENKKIFYLNFIHTVKWIDKNNIFFVKTKKDDYSSEGIYKYNFQDNKVIKLDNFFKKENLKTFPINISLNDKQYIFTYMGIDAIIFVNRLTNKIEKIISKNLNVNEIKKNIFQKI